MELNQKFNNILHAQFGGKENALLVLNKKNWNEGSNNLCNKNSTPILNILMNKIVPSLNKSLDFHSCLAQTFVWKKKIWHQNSQKVLPFRYFGGCSLLNDNLFYESPKTNLLLFTNQIAGIPSLLNL